MFSGLQKIFGSANDRALKNYWKKIPAINAWEAEISKLSDAELRGQTERFRMRLASGESLDSLLFEAFATVREAAKRVLSQRHYDVQLIGGMVLHDGNIAEMKTGEGKTLVATLAVYLNALPAKGVHVVTVNDYLAKRDSEWMSRVYGFLGLTTGCITSGIDSRATRKAQYAADITYGTNNEFGFDYLRDNMHLRLEDLVQRPFHYAIVDEVDSVLIDEARTPLIISGPAEDSSELYRRVDEIIPLIPTEDYDHDEKLRTAVLTEDGIEKIDGLLREKGLLVDGDMYDMQNIGLVHHVNQALRAHVLFRKDDHYIVKGGQVIIIDEFTGRMMAGRRFSDGLHQALEAKEKVKIENENQTLASITFQNYFRLYPKLAGMTGTAMTEAAEFEEIYNLKCIEIPTNRGVARIDEHDEIYRTSKEKYAAIVELIAECAARKQPVLVGTTSIEKSEYISDFLKKQKIEHQLLNARYHEQEAYIVAQAGRPAAVTIATNMAGRGTDIKLGGNLEMRIEHELKDVTDPEKREKMIAAIEAEIAVNAEIVKEAGGLYVIGTERHESRRIDNQLRGRSGRQGDPGASRFFLSTEDDLVRVFGDGFERILNIVGLKEGEAIVHPYASKTMEKAQKLVEAQNFDFRKNVLKYDDVLNDQRKAIYEQRREIMTETDIMAVFNDMLIEVVNAFVDEAIPPKSYPEKWNAEILTRNCQVTLALDLPIADWFCEDGITEKEIYDRVLEAAQKLMADKNTQYTPEVYQHALKQVLLQTIDRLWKEHLLGMDHLRKGITLRAYAQTDPLHEYKREGFNRFEFLLDKLRLEALQHACNLQIKFAVNGGQAASTPELALAQVEQLLAANQPDFSKLKALHPTMDEITEVDSVAAVAKSSSASSRPPAGIAIDPQDPSTWGKISRNDPCPCDSGKKYKHCHGILT